MKIYAEKLCEEMGLLDQEAGRIYEKACQLPCGEARDVLARSWALRRGEVRGVEIALGIFRDHLRDILADLEER